MRLQKQPIMRWLFISMMSLLLIVGTFLPLSTVFADDDSSGQSDMSLYQRASEVSRAFGTAIAPGSGVEGGPVMIQTSGGEFSSNFTPGNAGGLIGYSDMMADDKGIMGWFTNNLTTASATVSYGQMDNMVKQSPEASRSFLMYGAYGHALTEMGLIKPIRPGMNLGRRVASIIMQGTYLLAIAAPFLFHVALKFLSVFNPFRLLGDAIDMVAVSEYGTISDISKEIQGIYNFVKDGLALGVLIPMFFITTIFGIMLFRKSAGKSIGRLFLRVFMIFAGVPLIAATYTGVVDKMSTEVNSGSSYANYLIMSSYVDFEGWVRHSRLAPPTSGDMTADGAKSTSIRVQLPLARKNQPNLNDSNAREFNLRRTVLKINSELAESDAAQQVANAYSSDNLSDAVLKGQDDNKQVVGSVQKNEGNAISKQKNSFSLSAGGDESTTREVQEILGRHGSASVYSGSDFDGEVSAHIQRIIGKNVNNELSVVKMYSRTDNDQRTWTQKLTPGFMEDDFEALKEPIEWNDPDEGAKGLFVKGDTPAFEGFQFPGYLTEHIYNNGTLSTTTNENGSGGYNFTGVSNPSQPNAKGKRIGLDPIGPESMGGLSTLGMYNFLNTTFDDSGATIFSSKRSHSDNSRDSYASVVFAGSGFDAVLRYLENFIVMVSLAALTIGFGVMMIGSAIRMIPRVLTSVAGTFVGSIQGITKLLIAVGVLILEIIGLLFIYLVAENVIVALLTSLDSLVGVFKLGLIGEMISSLLTMTVTMLLTFFLLGNGKKFKNALEEAISEIINRMMSSVDTATGGKGLDIAKTTAGRVGKDGKLTDEAKRQDKDGFMGAKKIMRDAGELQRRQERADGKPRTGRQRLGERLAIGTGIAANRFRDSVGSGVFGSEGDREKIFREGLEADIERAKNPHLDKDKSVDDFHDEYGALPVSDDGYIMNRDGSLYEDENGQPVLAPADHDRMEGDIAQSLYEEDRHMYNEDGQRIDEEGNIIRDHNGDAYDENGDVISGQTGVMSDGTTAYTTDNGYVLDKDGDIYTDEVGQAFKSDEHGNLVDDEGNYVALDSDGVLKPIDSVPGKEGQPVKASMEAESLDATRADASSYAQMKMNRESGHYGMTSDGQVVDAQGAPMSVNGESGLESSYVDSSGYVVNESGERVPVQDVMGDYDSRGFEEVFDQESGETVLRHKGDEAMKYSGNNVAVGATESSTLTSLSKQVSTADAMAQQADANVEQLKESGANQYAVTQAERVASAMHDRADDVRDTYQKALQYGAPAVAGGVMGAMVSKSHVDTAKQNVNKRENTLRQNENRLAEMEAKGAPPEVIASQAQRVQNQRVKAHEAQQIADNVELAHNTGRTYNEVATAQQQVADARSAYAEHQNAYEQAVATGAPSHEVDKHKAHMDQASKQFSQAKYQASVVQQRPQGTPEQIDQARAQATHAQHQYSQLSRQIHDAQAMNKSTTKLEAKRNEVAQELQHAQQRQAELMQPEGWSKTTPVQQVALPNRTPDEARESLTSHGVNNYDTFRQQVTSQQQDVQARQQQVHQIAQKIEHSKKMNLPPQAIQQQESHLTQARHQLERSEKGLEYLQSNANGFLNERGYTAPVATQEIKVDGRNLVNDMVQFGHTQDIYNDLRSKKELGTITALEKEDMKRAEERMTKMREQLIGVGLKESALEPDEIEKSTLHVKQSWANYSSGR